MRLLPAWPMLQRIVLAWLLPALSASAATVQAAGPVAGAERKLLVEAVALMLFVVVPVIVLTPWVAWRYRRRNRRSSYRPEWSFSWLLEVRSGAVRPSSSRCWATRYGPGRRRSIPTPRLSSTQAPLEIQVVGLDWKWLFIYPQQHIATINALAFPVGRPVHLRLTSDTVMQSLLMPKLAGQIYAMPGMTTQLSFQADRAGDYLGENTQYNGSGFAKQSFTATGDERAGFRRLDGRRAQARRSRWMRRATCRCLPGARQNEPLYFSDVQPGCSTALVAKYHHGSGQPVAGAVLQPQPHRTARKPDRAGARA